MQLFSQKYAIILKKICTYFLKYAVILKKYATIMHLCKLDSLKKLV